MRRFVGVLAVAALLLSACEERHQVGSEELTNIDEQKAAQRLGEILKSPETTGESPASAVLGAPSPTPTGGGDQTRETFVITLTFDSPYYDPGQTLEIPVGTPIRVVNGDRERDFRRFEAVGSPYDSGDLQPGASYEFVANVKGRFQLRDRHVPFATGTLEVF